MRAGLPIIRGGKPYSAGFSPEREDCDFCRVCGPARRSRGVEIEELVLLAEAGEFFGLQEEFLETDSGFGVGLDAGFGAWGEEDVGLLVFDEGVVGEGGPELFVGNIVEEDCFIGVGLAGGEDTAGEGFGDGAACTPPFGGFVGAGGGEKDEGEDGDGGGTPCGDEPCGGEGEGGEGDGEVIAGDVAR